MSEREKKREGGIRGGPVGAEGEEMGGRGRTTRRQKRDGQCRKRVANSTFTF